MAKRPKRDPVLTAAVLKLSFERRGADARMFEEIYLGVLRDFELTDEEVDAYIEANRERVEALASGRSEDGDA